MLLFRSSSGVIFQIADLIPECHFPNSEPHSFELNENLMIFPFYNGEFYIKMVLRPKSEFVLLKGVCHE